MILRVPSPRLLPATIVTMGVVLLLKCALLAQLAWTHGDLADSGMVAVANAASTDRPPASTPPPPHPTTRQPPQSNAKAAEKPSPEPEQQAEPSAAPPSGPPPVSASERALLQDLRQRRKALDARAEAVTVRESVLAASEKKLGARLQELQALQKRLQGLTAAQKQKQDTAWEGLVKMYEAMKPRDAANIFNDLQMSVLLQVIDRMKDAKAAAIMAAMSPDKARDVTAQLAQLRLGETVGQPLSANASPTAAGG